ncbi:hypothetical protein F2Q70_00038764 [Brassica cretica]|uniref:Uncharacterized protein n=1 Tax=Brassica cretica TaxID=69181 RepID=A0A8S9K985_BRACR|nr:hypothetical protein F2Q70_00038764 [Brassica cretica]
MHSASSSRPVWRRSSTFWAPSSAFAAGIWLATIDGRMAVVRALQGETPLSLKAEEAMLSAWQDLGLLLVLAGAMTNSTYVSRYSFDLIPYRFKVHNRFSAYMTCLRYYPCVGCMRVIFARWLSLFRTLGVRCDQQRTWWNSSTRCLAGKSFLGVFATSRNAKG